jgi:hypothetical protein
LSRWNPRGLPWNKYSRTIIGHYYSKKIQQKYSSTAIQQYYSNTARTSSKYSKYSQYSKQMKAQPVKLPFHQESRGPVKVQ